MEEIFLTGGYGFIGSHLYNYLKGKNYSVRRLDKNMDIRSNKASNIIEKFNPEVIVHSAALVSSELCNIAGWSESYSINVKGTKNMYDISKKINSHFIHLSSTNIYQPTDELITEESKIAPQTIYGATKYLSESEIDHSSTILRLCHIFGPGETHSNIGRIIQSYFDSRPAFIKASRDNKKDYLYIDDCVRVIEISIQERPEGIYNISRQKPQKFGYILDLLESMDLSPIIELYPNEDYLGNHVVSSKKFRERTGWDPHIDIEEGIERCLKG